MADDDKKKDEDPKKCSKEYRARLELTTIIMTLFKNFVILGSIFLILQFHKGASITDAWDNLSQLGGQIQYLIILTLMLTFISIIDRFIYNNLMLGLGLGLGVAIVYILQGGDLSNLGAKKASPEEVDDEEENKAEAPAVAAVLRQPISTSTTTKNTFTP